MLDKLPVELLSEIIKCSDNPSTIINTLLQTSKCFYMKCLDVSILRQIVPFSFVKKQCKFNQILELHRCDSPCRKKCCRVVCRKPATHGKKSDDIATMCETHSKGGMIEKRGIIRTLCLTKSINKQIEKGNSEIVKMILANNPKMYLSMENLFNAVKNGRYGLTTYIANRYQLYPTARYMLHMMEEKNMEAVKVCYRYGCRINFSTLKNFSRFSHKYMKLTTYLSSIEFRQSGRAMLLEVENWEIRMACYFGVHELVPWLLNEKRNEHVSIDNISVDLIVVSSAEFNCQSLKYYKGNFDMIYELTQHMQVDGWTVRFACVVNAKAWMVDYLLKLLFPPVVFDGNVNNYQTNLHLYVQNIIEHTVFFSDLLMMMIRYDRLHQIVELKRYMRHIGISMVNHVLLEEAVKHDSLECMLYFSRITQVQRVDLLKNDWEIATVSHYHIKLLLESGVTFPDPDAAYELSFIYGNTIGRGLLKSIYKRDYIEWLSKSKKGKDLLTDLIYQ